LTAFAPAVEAQHTDVRAVEVGKQDVLEDDLFVMRLGDADHGIDDDFLGSSRSSHKGRRAAVAKATLGDFPCCDVFTSPARL
jgi:hypothetical protein